MEHGSAGVLVPSFIADGTTYLPTHLGAISMDANNRANILAVDDSLAAATRLKYGLEEAGFSVEIARDGCKAWDKARRRQFDLIVTDEQMPNMSGRELCRQLRGDPRYAHTPIIFLTASRFGVDAEELGDDLNVVATFTKPFHPSTLLRRVEAELAALRRFPHRVTDAGARSEAAQTPSLPSTASLRQLLDRADALR
jgi:DNA-binding response OmpR family regulator